MAFTGASAAQVMVNKLAPAVFRAVVVIVRTMNNVLGGMSFVTCARIVGSQKAAAPPPVETPKKGGKKGRGKQ